MARTDISLGVIVGATLASSFSTVFGTLDQRAARLGRSLREMRVGGAAEADLRRVGGQLERINTLRTEQAKRASIGREMLGTGAMAIGAAYTLAAPIKSAIEFESKMADVRKVSDLTAQELEKMGKTIVQMSTVMPMSAAGIASITEAGLQSNITKDEILGFSKAAIQMGIAFGMSGEEAGSTMAGWRAGMAINQKQTEELADAVNYLDTNMNASAKSISAVITRQGAVAKAAGLTTIETAALSAALLNSGVQEEIAATALKNLTNALTKGESITKRQREVYQELGIDAHQVALGMQKDAQGTIKNVFKLLSMRPKETQSALVGELFGEEAKGAIMPLLVNLKALDQAFDSVSNKTAYAGSMMKEYEVRSKTTENNAQLLTNKFEAFKITVGSALLPAMNQIFGVLGDVAMRMGAFAEQFPQATTNIVGLTVGLIGLKFATLIGAYAVSTLKTAWTIASGAVAFFTNGLLGTRIGLMALAVQTKLGAAAQWLMNASFLGCPIIWIIGGITAFGALAYTIYKNWEPIMAWFKENFAWLGTAVEKVTGYASQVGSAISAAGKWMTTPIVGNAAAMAKSGAALSTTTPLTSAGSAAPTLSGKQSKSVMYNTNATIHVTQQPGQNSEQLAEHVIKKLKQQEAKDQRRSLHD